MKILKNDKSMVELAGVLINTQDAMLFGAGVGTDTYYDSLKYKGAAYQVPAGYKLQIWAVRVMSVSAATSGFSLGAADAAATNQGAAPSGWAVISQGNNNQVVAAATIGATSLSPIYYEFAAGKYPVIKGANTPSCIFLGQLVAV